MRILLSFLLFGLLVSVIFDPTNLLFGAKFPFFLAYVFVAFLYIFMSKKRMSAPALYYFATSFILFVSFYGYFAGVLWGVDYSSEYAIYYAMAMLPFVLVLVNFYVGMDFNVYFIRCLKVFVVFFSALSFLFFLDYSYFSGLFNALNYDYEVSMIGYRTFGPFVLPMIYYKTSVLLLFLAGYLVFSSRIGDFLWFAAAVALLLLSGTRANMLAACFFVVLYFFNLVNYIFGRRFVFVLFIVFSVIFLIGVLVFFELLLGSFLDPSETSNSIKIGHYLSYMEFFNSNWIYFLFGSGYGSGMYSFGIESVAHTFELSYLELLRFLGVFFSTIFFLVIAYPLYPLWYKHKNFFFAWLFYIFVAASNPLLLSSTGVFALIFIYSQLRENTGVGAQINYSDSSLGSGVMKNVSEPS